MLKEQDFLREQAKRLKWQEGISYRTIAEDLLEMKYNSYINFINGYRNLGKEKAKMLQEFCEDML